MPDDFMGVAESNLVNVIRYGNIQVEFSPSSIAADQYFSNQDNNTATFPTLFNVKDGTHGRNAWAIKTTPETIKPRNSLLVSIVCCASLPPNHTQNLSIDR